MFVCFEIFSATPQMGDFVSMRSSNEPFKH
jgi:hypothetical protein